MFYKAVITDRESVYINTFLRKGLSCTKFTAALRAASSAWKIEQLMFREKLDIAKFSSLFKMIAAHPTPLSDLDPSV